MSTLIKSIAYIFVIGLVLILLNWQDIYHLVIGGVLLAIILTVSTFIIRMRKRSVIFSEDSSIPGGPVRSISIGILAGLCTIAILAGSFSLLAMTPLPAFIYDADRLSFNTDIEQWRKDGQAARIVGQVSKRLEEGVKSPSWRIELVNLQIDAMLQLAREETRPGLALPILQEVISFAELYGESSAAAQALLSVATVQYDKRRRFDQLREEGKWSALLASLNSEYDNPPPPYWALSLTPRIVSAHIAAANTEPLPAKVREHLQAAERVAIDHGLNDYIIMVQAQLYDIEASIARNAALVEQIAQLRETGRWPELITLLDLTIKRDNEISLAPHLYRALLDAAVDSNDSDKQIEFATRAVAVATRYALDDTEAKRRLDLITTAMTEQERLARQLRDQEQLALERLTKQQRAQEVRESELRERERIAREDIAKRQHAQDLRYQEELARQQREAARLLPIKLKAGVMVKVVQTSLDSWPLVLVDLSVISADGTPLEGLSAKDFVSQLDGQTLPRGILVPTHKDPILLNVLIDLDISSSTNGAPLRQAIRGTRGLLQNLGANTYTKLRIFNCDTKDLSPWTDDPIIAGAGLDKIKSGGKTGLYKTIESAISELKSRSGLRRIILFTDGKNSCGNVDLDQLLSVCVEEQIAIWVLALDSAQLDSATLRFIADKTDGQYIEANDSSELEEIFDTVSKDIRIPVYRFAVTVPPDTDPGADKSLRVTIGSGSSAVKVEIPIDF